MNDEQTKAKETEAAPDRGLVLLDLAQLPDRAFVDETALAHFLRCSPRTIQSMVQRFDLPPALELAGRKLWIVGRLVAWLTDREDRLAQDAERKAEKLKVRG